MNLRTAIAISYLLISFTVLFLLGKHDTLCMSNDGCGWGPVILVTGAHILLVCILFVVCKPPLGMLFGIILSILPLAAGIAYFLGAETGPKEYCGISDGVERCEICTVPLFPTRDSQSHCVEVQRPR